MLAQRTLGSHLSLPGREGLSVQDLATNDLRTLATLYGEQNAGTCDHSTLSAYIEKQAYASSKHWRVQDIKVRNSTARSDKAVLDCNSPTSVVLEFFSAFCRVCLQHASMHVCSHTKENCTCMEVVQLK